LSTRVVSPGAVVLAAAIPILFLHVSYQPGISVGFGSTTVDAYLSDFAVLAVVVAAAVTVARTGTEALAAGRLVWLAGGLFVLWMFVGVAVGRHHAASYSWHTHGVTAAKFASTRCSPRRPRCSCGARPTLPSVHGRSSSGAASQPSRASRSSSAPTSS
jgi:hypothetical protein